MPEFRARRFLPLAVALVITAYGAVLRLDALVERYGAVAHPGWARFATHVLAPAGAAVRPFALGWPRLDSPYVGGDPVNYLKYAREMRGFYQAHIREPVFLALTRGFLWTLSNQDIAISFASLAGSVLAILGTYCLGARIASPAGGLLAALIMAIDRDNITWAPDGWRDDTFTAAVVWAAWALLKFRADRSIANAILVGVTAAVACLTRITALSFIVPALALLLVTSPRATRGALLGRLAIASCVLVVLVSPYLVNCAIQLHDPLIAINYHTGYYRYGEGLPSQQAMPASDYVRGKLARAPLTTLDTAIGGLTVQPFNTKWVGLDYSALWLRPVLRWSSLAGLLMLAFSPPGRLLLVMLFTSLVPYAFTWNIGGGGEWRFTMHAYPFYLVAAAYAWLQLVGAAQYLRRHRALPPWPTVRIGVVRAVAMATVIAVACLAYVATPWFVVVEALSRGEDVNVGAGPRDLPFFRRGWSQPRMEGLATVRVSLTDRATVWVPLPSVRAYDAVLRFDPVAPELQHQVIVLLNRHVIAQVRLGWDPQRVGSYRIVLPAEYVKAGGNELMLVPDALVAQEVAGPRFAWMRPGERLGLRLWYVRVLP